mmetsp:Transcript_25912/g.72306  ORF Transcript_25912/g.72306 Transcript_25912/m.72306 type:complete len:206 (-) Transcript_25912:25-642(-)
MLSAKPALMSVAAMDNSRSRNSFSLTRSNAVAGASRGPPTWKYHRFAPAARNNQLRSCLWNARPPSSSPPASALLQAEAPSNATSASTPGDKRPSVAMGDRDQHCSGDGTSQARLPCNALCSSPPRRVSKTSEPSAPRNHSRTVGRCAALATRKAPPERATAMVGRTSRRTLANGSNMSPSLSWPGRCASSVKPATTAGRPPRAA